MNVQTLDRYKPCQLRSLHNCQDNNCQCCPNVTKKGTLLVTLGLRSEIPFCIKTKRQFITRLHPVEKILLEYDEQSECGFFFFILDAETNCEVVYKVEN